MGNVDFDLIRQARQAAAPGSSGTDAKNALASSDIAGKPPTRHRARTAATSPDPRFGREALLQAAIGHAVRGCRRRHDLNGLDLARAAGISLGMLSRIENGTVSPSLGTLQALASALGVPVTALLGGYNEHNRAIFVAGHQSPKGDCSPTSGLLVGEKASSIPLILDAFIVSLATEGDRQSKLEERGTFFVYCLAGEVSYLHASKRYHMAPGDSLAFEASGPHGIARSSQLPARLLVVRTYPALDAFEAAGLMAKSRQRC